jgi:flagellar basal-body rod protein FlgC
MDIYDITASALTAQRLRLDTIASNLANANTTRQADGSLGAYKRRNVVFAPLLAQANEQLAPGQMTVSNSSNGGGGGAWVGGDGRLVFNTGIESTQGGVSAKAGVQVLAIEEDRQTPTRMVYDPQHPDANEKGFVEMPNVNTVTEMVDMIAASRAYEASVTAFQSAKAMGEATLQM